MARTLYDNDLSGFDINSFLEQQPLAPDYSAMERLTFGGLAAFPRAIDSTRESLDAIGSWMGLTTNEGPEYLPSLPAGKTTGQNLADIAGAIAPIAIQLPVGGAIARGALGAAGITSPLAGRVLTDAALFGGLAAPHGGDVAAEQAAEGAGYGLLTALPRMQRLIPAGLLAAGSKLFFDMKDPTPVVGNWSQGDISALGGFVTSVFPGQVPFRKAVAKPPIVKGPNGETLFGVNPPEGNQPLFDFMMNPVQPKSAEESAMAMQELIAARQTARPPANPSPYEILGTTPVPYKSAAESAQVMETARAARDRAVELDVFRENRVLPAGYTPPKLREGFTEFEVLPPEPSATALQTTPDWRARAFDPANFAMLAKASGVPEEAIRQAMGNLTEIQFAQLTREWRQQQRGQMLAHARWYAGLQEAQPLNPLYVDELWEETIRRGTARPDLPEGLPPIRSEVPLQQGIGEAGTTNVARSRLRELPEYRRTEGGMASLDVLQALGYAGIRGTVGAGLGEAYNQIVEDGQDPGAALRGAIAGVAFPAVKQLSKLAPTAFGVSKKLKGIANPFPEGLPENLKFEVEKVESHLSPNSKVGPKDIGLNLYLNKDMGDGIARPVGVINAFTKDGKLQIAASDLDKAFQNKRLGLAMYDKLMDEADALGMGMASDNSVSESAQRVYQSLKKAGYVVEQNPEAVKLDYANGQKHLVTMDGSPVFTVSRPTSATKMRAPQGGKNPDEMAAVFPEMSAAMGRAAIGGLVGAGVGGTTDARDERSGMVLGAMAGVAAFLGGPPLARSLVSLLSATRVPKTPVATPMPKKWSSLKAVLEQGIEEKAGAVLSRGSMKVGDRLIRALDKGLELTLPPLIKETLLNAKGAGSVLLDQIDAALLKVSLRYRPDEVTKKVANQFLDGSITRDQFLQQLQPTMAANPNVEQYAKFIMAGRESMNGLQRMVSEGLGDPKKAKIINDSIGKYMTRSYRIFTNPNWRPSEESLSRLTDEIVTKKIWPGATHEDVRQALSQYVQEVKTAKGAYTISGFGQGQKINQAILKQRKDLSEAWREFLGEIEDPSERIYQTVFRLRPMAEASKYFSMLSKLKDEQGLPQVFRNYAEKDAFRNTVLQRLQSGNLSPSETEALNLQLKKLDNYVNVEQHPKFGVLGGNIVNRHVFDTLSTYDSLTDATANPYLRGIVNAHTWIKLGRTAFNPLTTIRNFVTTPAFMAIARTNPTDMMEAFSILKNTDHPMRTEVMQQGISNVDQVKTEFYKEFQNVMGSRYDFGDLDLTNLGLGKIDLDIGEKYARRGIRGILDFYRLPDNLVRIGAYISAKRRISEALGKGFDDAEVIRKATEFTNRYTMNYDAIAPAIKTLRQLPFANLFISYTAEMTRLAKNLVEDVARGDMGDLARHGRMYAALPLAGLAVIPELLESSSESNLKGKDLEDWQKAKGLMPNYSRTRYRYVTGRDKKTGQFHYIDYTPLVASDALNQLVRAVSDGDMSAAAAVNPVASWENTPVLNIAAEQIAGKDLRTHREFRGTTDRIAAVAKEVLPPWVPSAGSEYQRALQAHTRTASGELGTTNQKTGVRITPQDFWSSYFGPLSGKAVPPGARPGSVNLEALQRKVQGEAKSMVANETAYLNDVLKSDAADDIKQQAIDRFNKAIAEIQEYYASRLGVAE